MTNLSIDRRKEAIRPPEEYVIEKITVEKFVLPGGVLGRPVSNDFRRMLISLPRVRWLERDAK